MDAIMWRPPVNRLMRKLDRSYFQRDIPLKAIRVFENKNIFKLRTALERSKDILAQDRLGSVFSDPDEELAKSGRKCILLRPELSWPQSKVTDADPGIDSASATTLPWPHSPTVAQLVEEQLGVVIPYDLHLDYSYWTYWDILSAILPEDKLDDIPSGFTQVGHVAHLNLRQYYQEYKYLIAEILLDKNPGIQTVINKIDDVGEENEYRTFKYEVLAGPDNMNVTVSEEDCLFSFDFSKVYWNSRLHGEHRRIVDFFREGEAICDVMAGIGPFAIPAAKKKVFAWANDLNPDSYKYMLENISGNHVARFVQAFNEDGRLFIPRAVAQLAKTDYEVNIVQTSRRSKNVQISGSQKFVQPKTFQHFVLNLPASALTFLPSFIGIYSPEVRQRLPETITMPLIHVYCFNTKSEDNVEEGKKICQEISDLLGYKMEPGKVEDGKVDIYDVRLVAPNKRMFCASFRLPEEVAYRHV